MSACFKLKKLLLGSFLSAPPNPPTSFRVVPRSDGLDLSWTPGLTTSAYNTDTFEVEMTPDAPELRAVLSDAFGAYVNFYAGAEPACTVDNLRPEETILLGPRAMPKRCGRLPVGRHPRHHVPSPRQLRRHGSRRHLRLGPDPDPRRGSRPGASRARPAGRHRRRQTRRLEVRLDGVVAVAGALTAEVLWEVGDFEWGLRDVPGDGEGDGAREVFITLEKRVADCVKYDPMEQWDRLLDEEGHARIDPGRGCGGSGTRRGARRRTRATPRRWPRRSQG